MEETKLTVRVPKDWLEGAKQYAVKNNTTLTRLVSEYLRRLSASSDPLADAPIVRRLVGTVSPDLAEQDYREYLERKYGGQD